jgi:predicted PurR-regulated permease PerM
MRQLATLTIIILLTLLVTLVVWQLRTVVFMFVLALAIAAALDEPVDLLADRGWPRALAILTVYLTVFGSLAALLVGISFPLLREIDPLVQDFLIHYSNLQGRVFNFSGDRPVYIPRLPTTEQMTSWLVQSEGEGLAQGAMLVMQSAGSMLGQVALAIVVAIYWTADQRRFERLWLSVLRPERRAQAREFWRTLEREVGSYIRSEVVQSVIAGALFTVGYWLLGVKQPFTLAFLAALAWLVPLVGGIIAVGAALLIGSLSGVTVALLAAGYTIVVLLVMEFWLERRLYTQDRYWGVLVVILLLALGDALGVIGLLVAPPLAVAVQIAINNVLERPANQTTGPAATDLDQLRLRLAALQERIHTVGEESSPVLVSLMQRLEQLLGEAERSARSRQLP